MGSIQAAKLKQAVKKYDRAHEHFFGVAELYRLGSFCEDQSGRAADLPSKVQLSALATHSPTNSTSILVHLLNVHKVWLSHRGITTHRGPGV